ncbi:FcoT family thioesterase [Roseiconus lacunae]|uniref:FcoT family thioesterase n=1 Tax=Roseiconus lacunae TaxID=2605694 RepID=UPI001E28E50F|nr:FcoT family thioesterase [Roseiconus lacunae]MCD0458199.1 FcoT family thioesterase [Roseiconus lacunae]
MSSILVAKQAITTDALFEVFEVDHDFINRVLTPYRDSCRYLKSVRIGFASEQRRWWDSMVAVGDFEIDRSCYIDDTGHFNAVEFNICYNQLAYVLLAVCIRERLLPALDDFTLESFFEKQLSNYLIAQIDSHYHTELNPRGFRGEVRITSAKTRRNLSILKTACRFHDHARGRSDGEVKLVVLGAA